MRKKTISEKRFTSYKRKCFVCGKFYQKEKIKGNVCNSCREKRFKQK